MGKSKKRNNGSIIPGEPLDNNLQGNNMQNNNAENKSYKVKVKGTNQNNSYK